MPWILQFHKYIFLQSNSWELLYIVTCKEAWLYLEALTANTAAPSSINLFRGKAVQSAASSKERRILSLGLSLSKRSKSRWSATTWPTLLCVGLHINMLDPQQSKSRRIESRSHDQQQTAVGAGEKLLPGLVEQTGDVCWAGDLFKGELDRTIVDFFSLWKTFGARVDEQHWESGCNKNPIHPGSAGKECWHLSGRIKVRIRCTTWNKTSWTVVKFNGKVCN